MAAAGEHHGDAVRVAVREGRLVVAAPARLDHGADAGVHAPLDRVVEGEEGVRGHHGALQGLAGLGGPPPRAGDGELGRLDAAHLPRPDADGLRADRDHDRVRTHVLDDAEGEEERGALLVRGRALRRRVDARGVEELRVALLHQEAPVDRADVEARRRGHGLHVEDADVLPPLRPRPQAVHGRRLDAGRDDHLEEQVVPSEPLGERHGQGPRERDDAAEGAARVRLEREVERGHRVLGQSRPARVRVLDDHRRRRLEPAREPPGGVRVEVVVEGELLAPAHRGARERPLRRRGVGVERRRLVRVLAVAEVVHAPAGAEHLGQPVPRVGRQPAVDRGVVGRGARVGRAREGGLRRVGESPAVLGEVGEDRLVLRGVGHDAHAAVVLRGAADHRRPADVDLLDGLLERDARLAHRGLEGVEVHDDEVDRHDAVRRHRLGVARVVAQAEQRPVDLRVQGLHAPVQHLGEAGLLGDVLHGEARGPERLRGAAGRDQLDPARRERAGEVHEAGLVADGEERAADGGRRHGADSLLVPRQRDGEARRRERARARSARPRTRARERVGEVATTRWLGLIAPAPGSRA